MGKSNFHRISFTVTALSRNSARRRQRECPHSCPLPIEQRQGQGWRDTERVTATTIRRPAMLPKGRAFPRALEKLRIGVRHRYLHQPDRKLLGHRRASTIPREQVRRGGFSESHRRHA